MQENKVRYSILLPVYNQVENLPLILYLLYETSVNHALNFQVIIIEDNSPDKTRDVAKKLITFYEKTKNTIENEFKIILVERQGKLGLGSAYRQGLKKSTGQFVIIMDADLSHHPKYIPQMILQLPIQDRKLKQQNADIVSSTRYIEGGGVQGWNFMRKLTSRTANYVASTVLQSSFTDLTGSFRLYKKFFFYYSRQLLQQLMARTTTKGYSFQMEILIRAWKLNKIIVEQPIIFVDRLYGKSKLGPNQVFIYLKGVATLFFDY